jgi:DnaJ-class molecular chaperone
MKFLVALLIIGGLWWMGQRRRPAAGLTQAEARDLLGVSATAGEPEIRAAHRRLIGRVHPDAGGSAALAGRVNAARDLLVEELRRTQ